MRASQCFHALDRPPAAYLVGPCQRCGLAGPATPLIGRVSRFGRQWPSASADLSVLLARHLHLSRQPRFHAPCSAEPLLEDPPPPPLTLQPPFATQTPPRRFLPPRRSADRRRDSGPHPTTFTAGSVLYRPPAAHLPGPCPGVCCRGRPSSRLSALDRPPAAHPSGPCQRCGLAGLPLPPLPFSVLKAIPALIPTSVLLSGLAVFLMTPRLGGNCLGIRLGGLFGGLG